MEALLFPLLSILLWQILFRLEVILMVNAEENSFLKNLILYFLTGRSDPLLRGFFFDKVNQTDSSKAT